jgi:hypothetical protein
MKIMYLGITSYSSVDIARRDETEDLTFEGFEEIQKQKNF